MLVYSKQFLQDGAGATKWIRIAQQRGITDTFCVCKKKKTGPANVFDYPQGVSFLFTFCPPAYLADLSHACLFVT
jgi:hypothetical protein